MKDNVWKEHGDRNQKERLEKLRANQADNDRGIVISRYQAPTSGRILQATTGIQFQTVPDFNGLHRVVAIMERLSKHNIHRLDTGFEEEYDSTQLDVTVIILGVNKCHISCLSIEFSGSFNLLCYNVNTGAPMTIIMRDVRNIQELVENKYVVFYNLSKAPEDVGMRFSSVMQYFIQDYTTNYSTIEYSLPDEFFESLPLKIYHDETLIPRALECKFNHANMAMNIILFGIKNIEYINDEVIRVECLINRSLHDIVYILGYHTRRIFDTWRDAPIADDMKHYLIYNAKYQVTESGIKLYLYQETFFVTNYQLVMVAIRLIDAQNPRYVDVLHNIYAYNFRTHNNQAFHPLLTKFSYTSLDYQINQRCTIYLENWEFKYLHPVESGSGSLYRRILINVVNFRIHPVSQWTAYCEKCYRAVNVTVPTFENPVAVCDICRSNDYISVKICLHVEIHFQVGDRIVIRRFCVVEERLVEYLVRYINQALGNLGFVVDDNTNPISYQTASDQWIDLVNTYFVNYLGTHDASVMVTLISSFDGEKIYALEDIHFYSEPTPDMIPLPE